VRPGAEPFKLVGIVDVELLKKGPGPCKLVLGLPGPALTCTSGTDGPSIGVEPGELALHRGNFQPKRPMQEEQRQEEA
jgi:hypothetical protein